MSKSLRELRSVGEVLGVLIKVFGSARALGDFHGVSEQAVSNWWSQLHLPSKYYEIHKAELEARGFCASPMLWGIHEPRTPKKFKIAS